MTIPTADEHSIMADMFEQGAHDLEEVNATFIDRLLNTATGFVSDADALRFSKATHFQGIVMAAHSWALHEAKRIREVGEATEGERSMAYVLAGFHML